MENITRVMIAARLGWKCTRGQSGNWIGVCSPLRLTVQSDTWANLMEDISLALDSILKDLLASDELDAFLKEHGWTMIGPRPAKPENVYFDVPFVPIPSRMAANGPQKHAN